MLGLRRSMATAAFQTSQLKQAGKVVCIGRNYAYVLVSSILLSSSSIFCLELTPH